MMDEVNLELKIEGDSEGYITFECPFCESQFKLKASEVQDDENIFYDLFCPYCGLVDKIDHFYTKEFIEKAKIIIENYVREQINNSFKQVSQNMNKCKYITMNFKPLKKVSLPYLKEHDTVEEIFECPDCKNHEKILFCIGVSKAYCAYCGGDI